MRRAQAKTEEELASHKEKLKARNTLIERMRKEFLQEIVLLKEQVLTTTYTTHTTMLLCALVLGARESARFSNRGVLLWWRGVVVSKITVGRALSA